MRWRRPPRRAPAFTSADVQRRATLFLERSLAHGVTRVRTHTDVDPVVGMKSMEGVLAAKAAMAGRIDVDVIAFSTSRNDLSRARRGLASEGRDRPQARFPRAQHQFRRQTPEQALDVLLDLAERERPARRPAHRRASVEPIKMVAPMAVKVIAARDFGRRVTFSHLCALATLEPAQCERVDRRHRQGRHHRDRAAGDKPVPAGSWRRDARAGAGSRWCAS